MPNLLFIFHLLIIKTKKKTAKVPNRIATLSSMPHFLTGNVSSQMSSFPSLIKPRNIHGKPKPSKISNTFDPTALAMAMSASPARATIMEPKASGTEVPMASNVMPMTIGSMPKMQPIHVAAWTMAVQRPPIHAMDMMNVTK